MTWRDLSDDELTARLVQRGTPAALAEQTVADRDDLEVAATLGRGAW